MLMILMCAYTISESLLFSGLRGSVLQCKILFSGSFLFFLMSKRAYFFGFVFILL